MTSAQLAVLKTELQTDPRGYGYNAAVRNDTNMALIINTVRDGTNPPANPTADGGVASGKITLNRPDCAPSEILEAIDVRDLLDATTLTAAGVVNIPLTQSWLESITQFPSIRLAKDDGTKTQTRKNIDRITGNTNGSQTALNNVAVRSGSRAEEKFGFGFFVSVDDVSKSLN